MDEQILLVAFAIFALIVLVVAFVFRKTMVDDIFSDDSPSFSVINSPLSNKVKSVAIPTAGNSASLGKSEQQNPVFTFNRQNLSKLGKILAVIGTVMIIAPLPSSLDGLSFGIAFVGYILTRFSAPTKAQKPVTAKNSQVDTLRRLASKPEYREASRILAADIADKKLQSDLAQQQRAINYLQSKGISADEAAKNIALLARIMSQQVKK